MGHALLALLTLSLTAGLCSARHFQVKEKDSGQPCIMLDVSFNIEVEAMDKDGKVSTAILMSDDKDITVKGKCENETRNIGIFFNEKTMWYIAYEEKVDHPVVMYSVLLFRPVEIFGSEVNKTDQIGFSDPTPIYLRDNTHSYKCEIEEVADYVSYTPTKDYNYTVTVTIYDIQTQGMGLTDGKYGTEEFCHVPFLPTTHVTIVPHVTKTSVEPQTHIPPTQMPVPPPKAPTNTYSVKDGDNTCITMQTALTIVIQYPVTTSKKHKTANVNVPKDARASGDCHAPEGKQVLSIDFLNGWQLNFTFAKEEKINNALLLNLFGEKNQEPSYRISNITLLVRVHKNIFPESVLGEGAEYLEIPTEKKLNFPKKSANSGYYRCNSRYVNTLKKGVEVKTTHLKFKAFNADAKTEFNGKATVCGNDNHPQSKAGLIAGLLITAIVVVGIVVLVVVMVNRRRKVSYDSIQ